MTHQGGILVTSDSDNLPKEYKKPLDEAFARSQELHEIKHKTLQPIHIAFVNNYFRTQMDIVETAATVGITPKKAHEWLAEGHPVSEYIAKRLENWSNEVDVTMEEIIIGLKTEATKVSNNKTDTQAARVSAWDKLARIKGAYDKGKKTDRPAIAVQINLGDHNGNIEHS